eukprot:4122518-Prymnesium_polylepis.1
MQAASWALATPRSCTEGEAGGWPEGWIPARAPPPHRRRCLPRLCRPRHPHRRVHRCHRRRRHRRLHPSFSKASDIVISPWPVAVRSLATVCFAWAAACPRPGRIKRVGLSSVSQGRVEARRVG